MTNRQFWRVTPIGYIRSAYKETSQVPKGLGVEHHQEGILEILPEFQKGL